MDIAFWHYDRTRAFLHSFLLPLLGLASDCQSAFEPLTEAAERSGIDPGQRADRTTRIPGIAATYHTTPIVTQIFEGVIGGQYQVAELGFSYFLRTFLATGESPHIRVKTITSRSRLAVDSV